MNTVLQVLYVGVTYYFKTLDSVLTRENMKEEKFLYKRLKPIKI